MKRFTKVLAILTVASAVGITYAVTQLLNTPDVFAWDDEEDDSYWGHDIGGEG